MVDAAGTTVYTYDAAGQLLTEDGLFASDTVTNTYANRMRAALALAQPAGYYDFNGNLTNRNGSHFIYNYDDENRALRDDCLGGPSRPDIRVTL